MTFTRRDALMIAHSAHRDQTRYGGATYLTHVLRVAWEFNKGSDEEIVALLHDVVEDSDWTLDDLRGEGCPEHIVEAVDAITKRPCLACIGKGGYVPPALLQDATQRVLSLAVGEHVARAVTAAALDDPRIRKACKTCGGSGSEKREDYLQRVMRNPLAHRVKIADAMDNATDDARPGMQKRYEWVLEKLGAAEVTTLPVVGEEGA